MKFFHDKYGGRRGWLAGVVLADTVVIVFGRFHVRELITPGSTLHYLWLVGRYGFGVLSFNED